MLESARIARGAGSSHSSGMSFPDAVEFQGALGCNGGHSNHPSLLVVVVVVVSS